MKINWTTAALADVEACVPAPFRLPMQAFLQRSRFVGQGRLFTARRYTETYFIKFQHWLVIYLPLDEGAVAVIAVEYSYGQAPAGPGEVGAPKSPG